MYGKEKSMIRSLITLIISLLVIALAVGLILKYTTVGDKVNDLINPTFRVEYDGKEYSDGTNEIFLPSTGQATFKVRGVDNYKVRVTPNTTQETDFTYEIGNEVYTFSRTDLTSYFVTNESLKDGYFTIDCTQELSLDSVLSKIHGNAEVKFTCDIVHPYLLTFTSGESSVSFTFGGVPSISLPKDNVVF